MHLSLFAVARLALGATYIDFIPPNECVLWADVRFGSGLQMTRTLFNFSSSDKPNRLPVSIESSSLSVSPSNASYVEDYIYVPYQTRLKKTTGVLTRESYHTYNANTASKTTDLSILVRADRWNRVDTPGPHSRVFLSHSLTSMGPPCYILENPPKASGRTSRRWVRCTMYSLWKAATEWPCRSPMAV